MHNFFSTKAIAEYVWTLVTWLILALCVAAAVDRLLAAGAKDMCIACVVADGIGQPPAYPPIATNKSIEMQPAVDAIRTALNCGYSP